MHLPGPCRIFSYITRGGFLLLLLRANVQSAQVLAVQRIGVVASRGCAAFGIQPMVVEWIELKDARAEQLEDYVVESAACWG